jgi:hypothetical protein
MGACTHQGGQLCYISAESPREVCPEVNAARCLKRRLRLSGPR